MFDFDSETEFNYEGGEVGKGSLAIGVFVGALIVVVIMIIVASTTDGWINKLDWNTWAASNAANAKTERLSAVWKNSERLTSKDPEFKGAYERTCGGRAN